MKQRKSLGTPKSLLYALAAGIAVHIIFSLVAAAALSKTAAPENYIMPVSVVIPALSSALSGMLCAVFNKKSGLLCGAATGAILSLLLLTAGIFIPAKEKIPAYFTVIRCVLSIISGALCGFLTVYSQNGKKHKKPR